MDSLEKETGLDAARIETLDVRTEGLSSTELLNQARAGARQQENLSVLECMKAYPKAIAWSLLVSTAVIVRTIPPAHV